MLKKYLEQCFGEGNDNPVQSSCLKIPWTEEPDGLLFMGLQRAGHDWLSTSTGFGVWQALRESQLLKHESASSWGCSNKCHRLDDFPKRNSFSHSSEDWMFKVPVWQGSVSGESSLPGWQMATFCCVLHGRERDTVKGGPCIFSWHPDNQKWIMGPHLCPPGGEIWDHHTQFSSVAQSCPTLCDPVNRSTPGLPVHHQLPEFTQIHVHRGSDAIQPSHPLSSPSPPAPNPSQHQSLFQWVNSLHEVAKVLEFHL